MRGVCVDINNHPPTVKQLHALGADGVRIEIRAGEAFAKYTQELHEAGIQLAYLWGPSTDLPLNELDTLLAPDLLIIGNEPDGAADGMSWKMTILEYCALYNQVVAAVRTSLSWCNVPISTAGMISGTQYLNFCWDRLHIKPTVVNVHYPNDARVIQDFAAVFQRGVIVGETCYETGTRKEIKEWQQVLNDYTESSFWFQWIDFPGWTGSLYNMANKPKSLYYSYKAALRA
jgi:hypothetical protein